MRRKQLLKIKNGAKARNPTLRSTYLSPNPRPPLTILTERKPRQRNKTQHERKQRKMPSSPPKKKTPAPPPKMLKPLSKSLEALIFPHSTTNPLRQHPKQIPPLMPLVSTTLSTPFPSPLPTLRKRSTDTQREDSRLRTRHTRLDACQNWRKSIRG